MKRRDPIDQGLKTGPDIIAHQFEMAIADAYQAGARDYDTIKDAAHFKQARADYVAKTSAGYLAPTLSALATMGADQVEVLFYEPGPRAIYDENLLIVAQAVAPNVGHILAAGPQMLAALKRALFLLESPTMPEFINGGGAVDAVRGAIAAAHPIDEPYDGPALAAGYTVRQTSHESGFWIFDHPDFGDLDDQRLQTSEPDAWSAAEAHHAKAQHAITCAVHDGGACNCDGETADASEEA